MRETDHWGRSAGMGALLKNGTRSLNFGELGPGRAHIKAPTCLSGFSFDTIGPEMQYGPGAYTKGQEQMNGKMNDPASWI